MLIQILKNTPFWVFILFFVLLAFGLLQSQPRRVSLSRAIVIPIVMIALSISGVLSDSRGSLIALLGWLCGLTLAVVLSQRLRYPRGIQFEATARALSIPGSWIPLLLMMTIYFTKYGVAVTLALHPSLSANIVFVGTIGLVYGFLSGMFFATALTIWRVARTPPSTSANS